MNDGPADSIILGHVDRYRLAGRIVRGRESSETLTCLALSYLWNDPDGKTMSEPWTHDLPHRADELNRLARLRGAEAAEALMRAKYGDDDDDDDDGDDSEREE